MEPYCRVLPKKLTDHKLINRSMSAK